MSEKIQATPVRPDRRNWPNVFSSGTVIGTLGALIGLGGAEFRLLVLIGLFRADSELAGNLSLLISLPTMLTGIARYRKDQRFITIKHNRNFMLTMAFGSLLGSDLGGQLVGIVSAGSLLSLLSLILLVSAVKEYGGMREFRHLI